MMKKPAVVAVMAVALAVLIASSGCQSASSNSTSISSGNSAGATGAATVSAQSTAGNQGGFFANSKGIWAISSCSLRLNSGGTRQTTWNYGDDGRCLSTTWTEPDGSGRTTENTGFDDNGFSTEGSTVYYDAKGNVERTRQSSSTFSFDNGKMVLDEDSDGIATSYSYHENGTLKESTNSQGYVNRFDEQGRKIYYDGGFLNRERGALAIAYDEASGATSGWTARFENGTSYHFTCKSDANGNITEVYDPSGNLIVQATYQQIGNPCAASEVYSTNRVGTFVVVNAIQEYLGA